MSDGLDNAYSVRDERVCVTLGAEKQFSDVSD